MQRGLYAEIISDGILVLSVTVYDGLVDATSLEAHVVNESLALAKDLHIQSLVIASDCLQVVTSINKGAATVYAMVISEIKHRSSDFGDVCFKFEHRECNFEAHDLVKAAVSL